MVSSRPYEADYDCIIAVPYTCYDDYGDDYGDDRDEDRDDYYDDDGWQMYLY